MINEKKDACYHKVKSRYKVWPSAYASGALVKCRKKGAKNWGSSVKESILNTYAALGYVIAEMKELSPRKQQERITRARRAVWGKSKKKTNKEIAAQELRLTNKVEQRKLTTEGSKKGVMPKMKMGVHKSRAGGLTKKGVAAYRAANPGSKLKTAVTTKPSKLKKGSKSAKRRKSFCARMGGMKKRLTSAKTASDPNSRINKALRKWNC